MKVTFLSTIDIEGGASRSAYRLMESLRTVGVETSMAVQYKKSPDPDVHGPAGKFAELLLGLRSKLDRVPLWPYRRAPGAWSLQWAPNGIAAKLQKLDPQIVHLHWIGRGFVPIREIAQFAYPLVWTMHDMWALTGGCHYDQECGRWRENCGYCPQLHSRQEKDPSRVTWQKKYTAWRNLNIHIVTPSHWLADRVRASPLFQGRSVSVIPNGLDAKTFTPIPKRTARERLGLPADQSYIIFGAMNSLTDPRKGYHYLQQCLAELAKQKRDQKIALAIFGGSRPRDGQDLGFPSYYLGELNSDQKLGLAYSAGDVFLAPSLQDNLPNTVMEALACGTPCVAFNIGGMPDMIEHKINGYLAPAFNVADLAYGIHWVLEDKARHDSLCSKAREKVLQEFTLELQAERYMELYRDILLARS